MFIWEAVFEPSGLGELGMMLGGGVKRSSFSLSSVATSVFMVDNLFSWECPWPPWLWPWPCSVVKTWWVVCVRNFDSGRMGDGGKGSLMIRVTSDMHEYFLHLSEKTYKGCGMGVFWDVLPSDKHEFITAWREDLHCRKGPSRIYKLTCMTFLMSVPGQHSWRMCKRSFLGYIYFCMDFFYVDYKERINEYHKIFQYIVSKSELNPQLRALKSVPEKTMTARLPVCYIN